MLVGELHIMTRASQIPYIYETGSTPGNCLGNLGGIWRPCQPHQTDPPSQKTSPNKKNNLSKSRKLGLAPTWLWGAGWGATLTPQCI